MFLTAMTLQLHFYYGLTVNVEGCRRQPPVFAYQTKRSPFLGGCHHPKNLRPRSADAHILPFCYSLFQFFAAVI